MTSFSKYIENNENNENFIDKYNEIKDSNKEKIIWWIIKKLSENSDVLLNEFLGLDEKILKKIIKEITRISNKVWLEITEDNIYNSVFIWHWYLWDEDATVDIKWTFPWIATLMLSNEENVVYYCDPTNKIREIFRIKYSRNNEALGYVNNIIKLIKIISIYNKLWTKKIKEKIWSKKIEYYVNLEITFKNINDEKNLKSLESCLDPENYEKLKLILWNINQLKKEKKEEKNKDKKKIKKKLIEKLQKDIEKLQKDVEDFVNNNINEEYMKDGLMKLQKNREVSWKRYYQLKQKYPTINGIDEDIKKIKLEKLFEEVENEEIELSEEEKEILNCFNEEQKYNDFLYDNFLEELHYQQNKFCEHVGIRLWDRVSVAFSPSSSLDKDRCAILHTKTEKRTLLSGEPKEEFTWISHNCKLNKECIVLFSSSQSGKSDNETFDSIRNYDEYEKYRDTKTPNQLEGWLLYWWMEHLPNIEDNK